MDFPLLPNVAAARQRWAGGREPLCGSLQQPRQRSAEATNRFAVHYNNRGNIELEAMNRFSGSLQSLAFTLLHRQTFSRNFPTQNFGPFFRG